MNSTHQNTTLRRIQDLGAYKYILEVINVFLLISTIWLTVSFKLYMNKKLTVKKNKKSLKQLLDLTFLVCISNLIRLVLTQAIFFIGRFAEVNDLGNSFCSTALKMCSMQLAICYLPMNSFFWLRQKIVCNKSTLKLKTTKFIKLLSNMTFLIFNLIMISFIFIIFLKEDYEMSTVGCIAVKQRSSHNWYSYIGVTFCILFHLIIFFLFVYPFFARRRKSKKEKKVKEALIISMRTVVLFTLLSIISFALRILLTPDFYPVFFLTTSLNLVFYFKLIVILTSFEGYPKIFLSALLLYNRSKRSNKI